MSQGNVTLKIVSVLKKCDKANLVKSPLKGFKADRAYDSEKVYQDILKFSRNPKIKIAIPPRSNGKKACLFKVFLNKREQCNREWFYLGPYQWQKKSGYNKRGLVETAFMRYKKLISDRLYSRDLSCQKTESKISCLVLNKMLSIGKPISIRA